MPDLRTFWGKLVSSTTDQGKMVCVFEDESGGKHKVSVDLNMEDDWVAGENGVYVAEMTDTSGFGENPKEECGFKLGWDMGSNKLIFEITNPESVNVGMLKSIAEADPVSAIVYEKMS